MRTLLVLGVGVLAGALSSLAAADWPGWRGPDRTGVSKETGLLKTWPATGPTLVWESDKAGLGYAGLAIVGGTVYTMGARGDDEYILALGPDGKEKWATKVGPIHDWNANSWSRGPNCTPTVDGNQVYGLSSKGMLVCVDKDKGTEIWRLDLLDKLGGEVNPVGGGPEKLGWGYSWSALVDGDQLIIAPGGPKGLIAGLNKKDGAVLWRSKGVTDTCTYSSPLLATIGGVKQVLYLTQTGLVSVSAKDGELLWQSRREDPYADVVCPTPIVRGDMVYVSVGYGGGSQGLKIALDGKKFKVTPVYDRKTIGNKQGGVVLVGDAVYGYHEDRNWACQDIAMGALLWPKKSTRQTVKIGGEAVTLKAGGVLAADGRLYILDEEGYVAMLEVSPSQFKAISGFKLPKESKNRKSQGKRWTHPSLSDGKLYLRDQELVFCYQVK
jgi:outer membrane protein assembly factor BamB